MDTSENIEPGRVQVTINKIFPYNYVRAQESMTNFFNTNIFQQTYAVFSAK